MIKELICISCPNGCRLKVDTEKGYEVTGNKCEKGLTYGRDELLHPMRVVTSTVKIEGAIHPRLPVKTDKAVPKERIMQVMELMESIYAISPVKSGDILMPEIFGSDVNIIACKDM